ncbi:hypothetical protein [Xanthomonas populi]|uniref:hypothetical protein n=1 Tax=Xanthomonas populi TaxID=53414 RepID=UPI000FF8B2A0|nr:hypothetical protein [Xanthomonas populi]
MLGFFAELAMMAYLPNKGLARIGAVSGSDSANETCCRSPNPYLVKDEAQNFYRPTFSNNLAKAIDAIQRSFAFFLIFSMPTRTT